MEMRNLNLKNPDLINGLIQSLDTPETFDVPSNEELNDIKIGDRVKVGVYTKDFKSQRYIDFENDLKSSNSEEDKMILKKMDGVNAERMWFEIIEIKEDCFLGLCINNPVVVDLVQEVDTIIIKKYNVLDIHEEE